MQLLLNFKNILFDKQKPISNYQILIISLLLIIFRDFETIKNPFFYAEEGSMFFSDAYNKGFKFFLEPYVGYYQFIQNVATYLATFVDLENAPLVTISFSILIHLSSILIVLFIPSTLKFSQIDKLLVCVLIVVSGDGFQYSTTCGHFYLSLACFFLIFIEETKNSYLDFLIILLCIVSSLSCVYTCLFIPIFAYKWYYKKSILSKKITIIVFLGLIVQIISFLSYFIGKNEESYGDRFSSSNGLDFFAFKLYHQMLCDNFVYYFEELSRIFWLISLLVFIVTIIRTWKRDDISKILPIIIIFTSIFSILFSLGMAGGRRYMLISNIAFVLYLMYNKSSFNYFLIYCFVFLSCIAYKEEYNFMKRTQNINWKDEVKTWKKNPDYDLKCYHLGWAINLEKKQNH